MNIFQLLDEQFKKKVSERFKGKTKADEDKLRKCILDAFRETMYDIMMRHPELANKQENYYPNYLNYPNYPIYPWRYVDLETYPCTAGWQYTSTSTDVGWVYYYPEDENKTISLSSQSAL